MLLFGVLFLVAEADLFADVKHWRFVALALADDYLAAHGYGVHRFAHGLYGDMVGVFPVALPHGLRRGNGRRLNHPQKIESKLVLHSPLAHRKSSIFFE